MKSLLSVDLVMNSNILIKCRFPAFDWNDHKDDPHDGLPDIWNFEWILMNDNELLQKDKLII